MPTPTIPDGELFFNATLYTGNSGTQTITNGVAGQNFAPDMVWLKVRNDAQSHRIFDTVRGAPNRLVPNGTNAEFAATTELTAFTSTGFTLGSNTDTNGTGFTYVGWNWKAGGAAVTNTAGSITSQVSANTTSGFSIVTYTGNATSGATVGHGLGVTPSMIIIKVRNATARWVVYQKDVTTANNQFLELNSTIAVDTSGTNFWTIASTNSTTFGLGTNGDTNGSALNFVAYCWAPIAGYSAFGSYTGNGSTDGPFVYLGFRPRFVLIKQTSGLSDWWIWDTARQTFNQMDTPLFPNTSGAEATNSAYQFDILSNGFKMRNNNATVNGSGLNYIYAAFAENPFKYANAR